MRVLIICVLLLTIVLAGCGVSDTGVPPGIDQTAAMATEHATTSAATVDQAAIQQMVDQSSNEATIIAATMVAPYLGTPHDPAVATEVTRRYQANNATDTALSATLMALTTPLALAAPRNSDAASTAASAAYEAGAANAAANAANMTPMAGQSWDEVALMQEATIIAATLVALDWGAPVEPAVATEATRRYQDNSASIVAAQPTPEPATTPDPTPFAGQTPTIVPAPTPNIQSFPVAPAPSSLAGITLPATQEEVAALFRNMPPSIAGQDRDASSGSELRDGHVGVAYGKILLNDSGSDWAMPRIFLFGSDQGLEPSTSGWTGPMSSPLRSNKPRTYSARGVGTTTSTGSAQQAPSIRRTQIPTRRCSSAPIRAPGSFNSSQRRPRSSMR